MSATKRLVTEIEIMTGSVWTETQRTDVGELIRKYRFDHLAAAALKLKELGKTGNNELSEKLYNESKSNDECVKGPEMPGK
jgi:hypothetical protein